MSLGNHEDSLPFYWMCLSLKDLGKCTQRRSRVYKMCQRKRRDRGGSLRCIVISWIAASTSLYWILAPSYVAIICSQLQLRRRSGIGYANVALLHLNWHCCAPGLWGRALSDLIQSGWLNRWLTWWREEALRTDFKSSWASTHTKAPLSFYWPVPAIPAFAPKGEPAAVARKP